MTNITIYNKNLNSIIPAELQKKREYSEKNLQIISRGLEFPLRNIEDSEVVILNNLMRVAHDLGFTVDTTSGATMSRFEMCADLITASYSHFSMEQIKHAFLIAKSTEANLEKYGEDFNAVYLNRVLAAYDNYLNIVLPSIMNAESIAENRAETARKETKAREDKVAYNLEQRRLYYVNTCKTVLKAFLEMQNGAFEIQNVDDKTIKILSSANLVTFTEDEKLGMKTEALQLAKSGLIREKTQVENMKTSAIRKINRKREINKIAEILEKGNPTEEANGKVLVNAWWCRVGFRIWLDKKLQQTTLPKLKKEIMTAFYRAEYITKDDNFDFEDFEAELDKIKNQKENNG
jgi:hypothetical protein